MVRITKNELNYLIKHGARWHQDIFKTYSGHGIYYMCESPKNVKKLDKFHKETTSNN